MCGFICGSFLRSSLTLGPDGVNNENGVMENPTKGGLVTTAAKEGLVTDYVPGDLIIAGQHWVMLGLMYIIYSNYSCFIQYNSVLFLFVPHHRTHDDLFNNRLPIPEFSSCLWPALVTRVFDGRLKVITLVLEQDEVVIKRDVQVTFQYSFSSQVAVAT